MKRKRFFLFVFTLFIFNSCVEPFEYKTLTFESALVVEASISSENKKQSIKLSRTSKIEDSNIIPETNAIVKVVDDLNNVFNFTESSPGNYTSDVSFKAIKNIAYQLEIKTQDNKTYTSNKQKIISDSPLQNITAKATTFSVNGVEKEGITISAESFDSERKSNYYRFEYEETYKVIAPFWVPEKIEFLTKEVPYTSRLVKKVVENKTCYKTNLSNEIIQAETLTLNEDRVNTPIKLIEKTNFSIKYRYSILVKQYIQSREAYTFYKILDKLSSSESLFSQNQPGTLVGNVYATGNNNENVLGFFEVASVSSKRIFFNYSDFYEINTRPDHLEKCSFESPVRYFPPDSSSPLLELIEANKFVFYEVYSGPYLEDQPQPPYTLISKSCGDCTAIGSNIKPTFWIE